jgi:class 3 adenylate cyclase
MLLEGGLVHGLPVIEAVRLKDRSKPRQILATARFATLAGLSPEEFDALGEVELKGMDRRVAIVMLR